MAILAIWCVLSIILRYRRATLMERKQINWLLYAVGLFSIIYPLYLYQQNYGHGFMGLLLDFSFLAVPVTIGIAILRYQLFDIDVIIQRTLQYTLLTGLLALVYFGSVLLLQNLVESLTGQRSPIVIVISTLTIAALFNPLRTRVQEFIDRRFYRQKYNAEQTLAQFAATTRDEVDMDNLTAALLCAVEESMQPETITLWLIPVNSKKLSYE